MSRSCFEVRNWASFCCRACILLALGLLTTTAAAAQECPGDFCENMVDSICDGGGFLITLTDYTPAPSGTTGFASYTYQICSPVAGTCSGNSSRSCLDNDACAKHGEGTCSRQCAVEKFHDLSHLDIPLPDLGAGSCLPATTEITASCTGGSVSYSDSSCNFTSAKSVVKCDGTLAPGHCYSMTINIAGELNQPGLGAALSVSKESTDCNNSCIAGPSCDSCIEPPIEVDECLTRTAGFWGTHPHITDDFLFVTVCGVALNEVVDGVCDSATEALCVSGGKESKGNPDYTQLVRQLTAAKLNLVATQANGGSCGSAIEARITQCEALCGASKSVIAASNCVADLTAFNESQDTFDTTPSPFDHPGPADSRYCRAANGNGLVIGKCN